MNLRNTLYINNLGHLEISGCDTTDLVKKYSTPLFVMDTEYIAEVINSFKLAFEEEYSNFGSVAYASKAFSSMAIYKLIKNLNIYTDVVSMGEMYTAVKSTFDLKKAFFHGNNKLIPEIKYAIDNNIGYIVIDSIDDINIINDLAKENNIKQDVIIRLNTGVEAHTHDFIKTSTIDSKFGFSILDGAAKKAISIIIKKENLNFVGVHSHIGSQIFEKLAFKEATSKVMSFINDIKQDFNVEISLLNMGGGFGVHYTNEDPKFTPDDYRLFALDIIKEIKNGLNKFNLKKPYLILEPGRSVVAEAGITLYSVGTIKNIEGIKKYVNIDGGMTDNIRPALYDAKYDAIIANRCNDKKEEIVSIAGKCCESGDIIIKDINLPKANRDDILAVFTTGAYNYSMASNYNRNPKPAVIFVNRGRHSLVVKREDMEDIVRNDVIPEWI